MSDTRWQFLLTPGSLQFTQAVVQNFNALQVTVTALKQPFRD
jgi:hypothetical protein